MTARILFCLVAIFFLGSPDRSVAGEVATRQAIVDQVSDLFMASDFEGLEALAEEFRDTKARTASGVWKLGWFYRAFGMIPTGRQVYADADWLELMDRSALWQRAYPESPTPYIARAIILMRYGQSFRGGGRANTVPEENWKPFFEYTARAESFLVRHKQVAKSDPHWYAAMADAFRRLNAPRDKFQTLIDEGLAQFPDYYEIYFSAAYYYLPQWHGDAELLEQFVVNAVERTRDFEGVGMYARIYWAVGPLRTMPPLFMNYPASWERMKQGIHDVLARYPDAWNLNHFTHYACVAGDWSEAKKLMAQMTAPPLKSAWGKLKRFEECRVTIQRQKVL